ncbi:MAG: hypothetical protein KC586_06725 [Myxococcales bacterium]|nr:hypothetical protein [Myxococcales bacterium]
MDGTRARELLGLEADERDAKTIRRAYLRAIKTASPERDPDRFQALREAYECLRDEADGILVIHGARFRLDLPKGPVAKPSADAPPTSTEADADARAARDAPSASSEADAPAQSPRARATLALAGMSKSDALDETRALVRAHPDEAWAWSFATHAAWAVGELDEALEHARRALVLGDPSALLSLARDVNEKLDDAERTVLERELSPLDAFELFVNHDPSRALRVFRAGLAATRSAGEPLVASEWLRRMLALELRGGPSFSASAYEAFVPVATALGREHEPGLVTLHNRCVEDLVRLPELLLNVEIRRAIAESLLEEDPVEAIEPITYAKSLTERQAARMTLRRHAPQLFRTFGNVLGLDPYARPRGRAPWAWLLSVVISVSLYRAMTAGCGAETSKQMPERLAGVMALREQAVIPRRTASPITLHDFLCRAPSWPECDAMIRLKRAESDAGCATITSIWASVEERYARPNNAAFVDVDPELFLARRASVLARCPAEAP